MDRKNIRRSDHIRLIISISSLCVVLVYSGIISKSYASEFHRWTDEDGTVHVSDVQLDYTLHKNEVKSIGGLPEPLSEEEMKAKDIKHPEYSKKEAACKV